MGVVSTIKCHFLGHFFPLEGNVQNHFLNPKDNSCLCSKSLV